MQDRFKYRCWHDPTKTMYEVFDFNENFIRATPDFVVPSIRTLKTRDCVLLQCTGLKDINRKLIYEGDIVRFYFYNDEIIAVIEWDYDECRFYLNTTDYFEDKYVTDYEIVNQEKYEVIGNIYENSQL